MSEQLADSIGGDLLNREIQAGPDKPVKDSEEGSEESKAKAQVLKGEPSGEGLFDGMKPEQLHQSYKELQREFGKRSEQMKQIDAALAGMGGIEQVQQWFKFLSSNPRFNEWVKAEQSRNAFGINMDELDDDAKSAFNLVLKVAEQVADQKIKTALSSHVGPLTENMSERLIAEHFNEMDEQFDGWREFQEDMAVLAEGLPQSKQTNPAFEDIEDLYWKAVRKSGKMDAIQAKMYEKALQNKKAMSTDKPASATPKGVTSKTMSLQEAFAMAKEQVGG